MPRIARLTDRDQPTIYHLISRTALDGYPMGEMEKEYLVSLFKKYSGLYFTDVLGYCVMGNHFHLVVKMNTADTYKDEEIIKRLKIFYGENRNYYESEIEYYRKKLSDISWFMKEIKQKFTRNYNRIHNRTGFFWGGRFKSLIVENGDTLVNLLAYVDLNPVRAGIVKKPEAYRWSSIGYNANTDKKNWLSSDYGLTDYEKLNRKERFRKYRAFVYEMGSVGEKGKIPERILNKEKKKDFKYTKKDYFTMKTRWFSDSGVIGSKAFIESKASKFKEYFNTKNVKKPNPISGLGGIFSLKRLS